MFQYATGISANTNAFFPIFETFAIGCGWNIVSGHGTQDMVFSSNGEGWKIPKTKLFIRLWKSGDEIHGRVQDNAVGTHATTRNSHVNDAAGANWTYHLSGDKDAFVIHTNNAGTHREMYIGLVLPFALAPADETYYSVEEQNGSANVLRLYTGVWSQNCGTYIKGTTALDPFDNTVQLWGWVAGEPTNRVGQFKHCSYRTNYLALNDTVTTGFSLKDTTTWLVIQDQAGARYCIRTGGFEPTGDAIREDKAHFAVLPCFQIFDSREFFDTYLIPFLTGIGWTATNNTPISGIDRDYIFHSTGESGLESIYIRFYWARVSNAICSFALWDDNVPTHSMGDMLSPVQTSESLFRCYIAGDRDCILFMSMPDASIGFSQQTDGCNAQNRLWWMGRLMSFTPGLLAGNTPYSTAYIETVTGLSPRCRRMRTHAGAWTPAVDQQTNIGESTKDGYTEFNNPQPYDALTYSIFPAYVYEGNYFYGQAKYLYNVNVLNGGTPGDIIEIDSKQYQIFKFYTGNVNLCTWYALRIV